MKLVRFQVTALSLFVFVFSYLAVYGNLVVNPGFESPDLAGWKWKPDAKGESQLKLDSDEKFSGQNSVYISGVKTAAPGVYGSLFQRVTGLKPGAEYEISAWVKGRASRDFIGWFGGGPGWNIRPHFPPGTYDWQRVSTRFRADKSGGFDLLFLASRTAEGIWLDEVSLEPSPANPSSRTFSPTVSRGLPSSAAFCPAIPRRDVAKAPLVSLRADPHESSRGSVRITHDTEFLYLDFITTGAGARRPAKGDQARVIFEILSGEGTARRPQFIFRFSEQGQLIAAALAPQTEWLSVRTEDVLPFDWAQARLAGQRMQDGYRMNIALPRSALFIGDKTATAAQLSELNELGIDVLLNVGDESAPDETRLAGRWMPPGNDDARGSESLATLTLYNQVPPLVSRIKNRTKPENSVTSIYGQYWEYAFDNIPSRIAQLNLLPAGRATSSEVKADLTLDYELPALDGGHSRKVSFWIPSQKLPRKTDYMVVSSSRAAVGLTAAMAEGARGESRFVRLSFDEQVAPILKQIKARREAIRIKLNGDPKRAQDSYVVLGQAVLDRFVDRLDAIGAGRGAQLEEWSVLQINELEKVMSYLEEQVSFSGTPRIFPPPSLKLEIRDGLLVDQNGRPSFAYGFGHFDSAARDVPFFSKIGAGVIEQERGPSSLLADGTVAARANISGMLGGASRHSMRIDLMLSPHYFPKWALDANPALSRIRTSGFINYNIDHPVAREVVDKWIRHIVPQTGNNPALFSYGLSNEPLWANSGNCEYTRPAWIEFLRKRHGSIAGLNQTWGSSYRRFEDVPATEPEGGVLNATRLDERRRFYDWIIFNQQNFADWHRWMNGIVKGLAPDVPTHAKIMGIIFQRTSLVFGVDPELISSITDFAGNDAGTAETTYPSVYAYDWHHAQMWYDLLHSFYGQPVYNSENHLIRDNQPAATIPPAHTYTSLWQGALHHQAASAIWVWEPTGSDPVTAGSIYMRPGNTLAAGRAMLDINRLSLELATINRLPADIAILYSIPSVYWEDQYPKNLASAHAALTLSGRRPTFISERQLATGERSSINKDIRWIVLPQSTHISKAAVDGLVDFVRQGGRLIALGEGNLAYDEYHRSHTAIPSMTRVAWDGRDDQSMALALRTAMARMAPNTNFFPELTDESGIPLWGVEYRIVQYGELGHYLVPLTNVLSRSVTIKLPPQVTARDLISGGVVENLISLEPMSPLLLEIRN